MKQSRIIGIALIVANGALILLCALLYLGKDRQKPELTFQAVETVYREGMDAQQLLTGVTAWDPEDGDLSDRIIIEKISENREEKTAVVFYAVSDKAGNVARASRVFDAVFIEQAGQSESGMAELFLEAGITAELKKGNVSDNTDAGEMDEETEDGRPDNADGREEDGIDSDMGQADGDIEDDAGNTGEDANDEEGNRGEDTGQRNTSPDSQPTATERTAQAPTSTPISSETQEREPETENGSDSANGQADSDKAPVLGLKVSEVKVKAGEGPAWVDLIGTLSDDKDGYETLFSNLNVSRYDRNKPGTYQVSVSTVDSDGNRSQEVPLTIIVE